MFAEGKRLLGPAEGRNTRWTLNAAGQPQAEQFLEDPNGDIKYLARFTIVLKRLEVGGIYAIDVDVSLSPIRSGSDSIVFTRWKVNFLNNDGSPLHF